MLESVNFWTCNACGKTVKTKVGCIPQNWRRAKISVATRYDSNKECTSFGGETVFDMCPSCAKEVSDILMKEDQQRKLDITVNGETVKEILK